jgi:hypothetical protein
LINQLKELRQDGRVIDENMTFDVMVEQGWEPSLVIEVQWQHDGKTVRFRHPKGVSVHVVSDRSCAALLLPRSTEPDAGEDFMVVNADGSLRYQVSEVQTLNGRRETGRFEWFEDTDRPDILQCMFRVDRNQAMFALDMELSTGKILSAEQLS